MLIIWGPMMDNGFHRVQCDWESVWLESIELNIEWAHSILQQLPLLSFLEQDRIVYIQWNWTCKTNIKIVGAKYWADVKILLLPIFGGYQTWSQASSPQKQ